MYYPTLTKKTAWVDKPAVMNNLSPPIQNEWVTVFREVWRSQSLLRHTISRASSSDR